MGGAAVAGCSGTADLERDLKRRYMLGWRRREDERKEGTKERAVLQSEEDPRPMRAELSSAGDERPRGGRVDRRAAERHPGGALAAACRAPSRRRTVGGCTFTLVPSGRWMSVYKRLVVILWHWEMGVGRMAWPFPFME